MRLDYCGESRWTPLQGQALNKFKEATGAITGHGLPAVEWQSLPFYDFTALVRLPDPVGGDTEWYLTNGGRFFPLDKFGVAIAAMNEVAHLRLTHNNVAAYLQFWAYFTKATQRVVLLNSHSPELAEEAAGEADPLLRGVFVEGQDPKGWLLSATMLYAGEIQRRYVRVSFDGLVTILEQITCTLSGVTTLRKAS